MKLALPDVTLVMTDTRCHELAKMAVEDCLAGVDFGEVLIFSDQNFNIPDTVYNFVHDWPNKDEAQKFLWCEVPFLVHTRHFLFCEWDAWITRPDRWNADFLNYDYIGAPWSWIPVNGIGNGGFSLRSTQMARYVAEHEKQFPIVLPFIHDLLLCQVYRPLLEKEGFTWPSTDLASRFAFETKYEVTDSFGFHALYNWPLVLSGDRLKERVQIARSTRHVLKTQRRHLDVMPC